MPVSSPLRRVQRVATQRLAVSRARRQFKPHPQTPKMEWVGSSYGGWGLPASGLGPESVCYLAGVGEDVSFDLALIERYGCTVHAFDPVPEAVAHAGPIGEAEPLFHFHPHGLWSSDTVLSFHDNPQDGFVSRSATDMHGTAGSLDLPVRSIPSVMAELGHERIDLLKLSVEGSEYELIDDIIRNGIPVGCLCVEFAQPTPLERVRSAVDRLDRASLSLAYPELRPFYWKFTFLLGRDST